MGTVDRGLLRRCQRLRGLKHRAGEEQLGCVDEMDCASVLRFLFEGHPVRKAC